MRERKIVKCCDLLTSQHRVTFWLECGHVLSLSEADLAMSRQRLPVVGQTLACHHCPDETLREVRDAKTAHQLWREAGEP